MSGKISKVLIVDDAMFIRRRLKKIVETIDSTKVVGEATNGEEAISLYKDLKPDLVCMDLVMPEKDGLKAIEEIIKFDKKAKIVVVSAMGQQSSVLEALGKGAKEFIQKPFRDDDVYTKIERLLKKK
ncbi:hypothetical protein LCGC14_0683990 [marine sediment metagenome]|uniref:Response regulatory domain-containing protein n=1 Tax=marine sediment metagenome TaxID=412755 RepID=A0A0F9R7P9_9ZZZZ|nr:MAG: Signal transduction response regulator [Candidatus Lokiarchaeum sp. GC14_75]